MSEHKPPTEQDVIDFIRETDPRTVHHTLGMRITRFAAEGCVVETEVNERLFQHAGIVHGGIYALMAESAASTAAAFAVDVSRFKVAGQELSASHVRSATGGSLRAEARLVHRGKSSLVYVVDVDNDGRLVSTCRITMAVRPHATG